MCTIKKFKKILILGNGGSGKSTLARRLSNIFNIPILHLDMIYWKKTNDRLLSFDISVKNFMEKEKWIIEGTPMRNFECRILNADTIVFIDFNRIFCIYRLIKRRVLSIFKKSYYDGYPIKIRLKDILWVWKFNSDKRQLILSEIEKSKKINNTYFIKNKKSLKLLIEDVYNVKKQN